MTWRWLNSTGFYAINLEYEDFVRLQNCKVILLSRSAFFKRVDKQFKSGNSLDVTKAGLIYKRIINKLIHRSSRFNEFKNTEKIYKFITKKLLYAFWSTDHYIKIMIATTISQFFVFCSLLLWLFSLSSFRVLACGKVWFEGSLK